MSWRIIFVNILSWFINSKADKYSVTGSRSSSLNFKDYNPSDTFLQILNPYSCDVDNIEITSLLVIFSFLI